MSWTDERVELLKKLWTEGLSASQIAGRLGDGVTRNAVIGKVHRLNLSGRVQQQRVAQPRQPRKQREPSLAPRAGGSMPSMPTAGSSALKPMMRAETHIRPRRHPRAAAAAPRRPAEGRPRHHPPSLRQDLQMADRRPGQRGVLLLRPRPPRGLALLRIPRQAGLPADAGPAEPQGELRIRRKGPRKRAFLVSPRPTQSVTPAKAGPALIEGEPLPMFHLAGLDPASSLSRWGKDARIKSAQGEEMVTGLLAPEPFVEGIAHAAHRADRVDFAAAAQRLPAGARHAHRPCARRHRRRGPTPCPAIARANRRGPGLRIRCSSSRNSVGERLMSRVDRASRAWSCGRATRSPALSWSATASGLTRRRMVRMRASSSGTEKGFTM